MQKMNKVEHIYCYFKAFPIKLHTLLLSPCFHKIGHKSSIMPPFRFSNLNSIEIGNRVIIHPNCWILAINPDSNIKLTIGDSTSIGMNSVISAAHSIVIKNSVTIGPKVFISDHNHCYNDINIPISKQGIEKVLEVIINEGSWIGYGAAILPGLE